LPGDQDLAGGAAGAAWFQGLPQALDVRLQGLDGGRWWLLAPQPPDERLHRHDLVGSCQQLGQQQAFLLPPQHDRAVVGLDLQRPEHLEPHARERSPPLTGGKGPERPKRLHCHRAATRPPPPHHQRGRRCLAQDRRRPRGTARGEEDAMQLDPPAQDRQARRRLRAVLAWSGLTLLAALAIALALIIATLTQELGSEPAPPPTAPTQIGPSGGGGHPVAQ
jgi:hypothetical protein